MTGLAHRHSGGLLQVSNVGPSVGVMTLMALHAGCRILRRLGLPAREEDMEVIFVAFDTFFLRPRDQLNTIAIFLPGLSVYPATQKASKDCGMESGRDLSNRLAEMPGCCELVLLQLPDTSVQFLDRTLK